MFLEAHVQRVCRLYKKAARCIGSNSKTRLDYRYNVTILRSLFDQHKHLTSGRKIEELLVRGEEELRENLYMKSATVISVPNQHILDQTTSPPDWMLDSWYPVDYRVYPDYFKRREQRKKEYTDWWTARYGNCVKKTIKSYRDN